MLKHARDIFFVRLQSSLTSMPIRRCFLPFVICRMAFFFAYSLFTSFFCRPDSANSNRRSNGKNSSFILLHIFVSDASERMKNFDEAKIGRRNCFISVFLFGNFFEVKKPKSTTKNERKERRKKKYKLNIFGTVPDFLFELFPSNRLYDRVCNIFRCILCLNFDCILSAIFSSLCSFSTVLGMCVFMESYVQ